MKTKKDIETSLGLIDKVQIEESPDHPNIFFSALLRPDRGDDKLEPILSALIEELKAKRLNFPLTIVYGTLKVIWECFLFTSNVMGVYNMNQVEIVMFAINRLFSQFYANYPEHERERIVDLVSGKSKLRLLFVTVAFGIGVDVNNIRRVIHIHGVPPSIEEYFQEARRCGRDGLPASSTIYYNWNNLASSLKKHHSPDE